MLKQNQIPNGWVETTLGEIITLEYGKSLVGRDRVGTKYNVWGSNGVVGKNDEFCVEGPVIIIGRKGSVGTVNYSNENCWAIDTTYYVKPTKSLNFLFIYYMLKSLNLEKLDKSTTIPGLNRNNIYDKKIILPPRIIQDKIVNRVEEIVSELIIAEKTLNYLQNKLLLYRYATLKHAFDGKLTSKWRRVNPYQNSKSFLKQVFDYKIKLHEDRMSAWEEVKSKKNKPKLVSKLSLEKLEFKQIPSTWNWNLLGNLSNIIRGASPRPAGDSRYFGGNIPWITVGEITKDDQVYIKTVSTFLTELGKQNSRFIKKDSLLLSNSGATLGVPKITSIDGCINDGSVAILDIINEKFQLYLYWFLRSKTIELRKISQGAGQPNLNTEIVKNILVPIPPEEEQLKIIDDLEYRFTISDKLKSLINDTLVRIKASEASLLDKAFSGLLLDTDDDNDGSIMEMLKSIKAEKKVTLDSKNEASKAKPKRMKSMEEKKTILEVLSEANGPISSKDVWLRSKHKDDIEAFYSELRDFQSEIIEIKKDAESLLTLRK